MTEAKLSIQQATTEWLDKGLNNKQIEAELLGMGIDERNIPEMLKEISKMRNARNTTKGLYFILAGALLCLFSCVFTLVSLQSSAMILYGLTSLGIIIIFIGLGKIFG